MSIRTVIEINHDYLGELSRDDWHLEAVLRALRHMNLSELQSNYWPGVRILAQRHHSESLNIKVE